MAKISPMMLKAEQIIKLNKRMNAQQQLQTKNLG
jgi:hypothetical protein